MNKTDSGKTMKQLLIVILLLGYFSSGAQAKEGAEDGSLIYFGVSASQVESEDIDNYNYGIVIGGSIDKGPGAELFYSNTFDGERVETTGFPDVDYSTQVFGLLGTYRFGTQIYTRLKLGYASVDVRADVAGSGTQDFDEAGWSYGIGVGIEVGKRGAVELNYLVLPDIDLTIGDQFETVDSDLISLGYNWYF
jgi:hypothetical protein